MKITAHKRIRRYRIDFNFNRVRFSPDVQDIKTVLEDHGFTVDVDRRKKKSSAVLYAGYDNNFQKPESILELLEQCIRDFFDPAMENDHLYLNEKRSSGKKLGLEKGDQ